MPVISFGGRSSVDARAKNSPSLPVDKYGRTLRGAQRVGASPLKDWAGNWLARKAGNVAERLTGLPFSEFGSDPVSEQELVSDSLMTGVAQPAMTVYHGTGAPKFNQFDWDKIGSGEGAQAYSHGMYTAGDTAVAKQYYEALKKEIAEGARYGKKSLADVISAARGASKRAWDSGFMSGGGNDAPLRGLLQSRKIDNKVHALEGVENNYDSLVNLSQITDPIWGNNSAAKLRQAIQEERNYYANRIKDIRRAPEYRDPKNAAAATRQIGNYSEKGKFLRKAIPHISPGLNYTQGGIIKADIPDDVASKMLRWDSSLYEQPTRVQEFLTHQAPGSKDSFFDILQRRFRADRGDTLQSASPGAMHGSDIYRGLATELEYGPKTKKIKYRSLYEGDPKASQLMNDAGITGTKFLSGFNRHSTKTPLLSPPEAFNYVSFRDYLPKILDYYPESRFGELGIR